MFEYALTYTAGEDLSKILWLKSENSESWLQRRATYTRSLAVMSMVGYVLGLGDRHPSNLMLDRKTGKVLHIDFGDCFEVAMQREKFPEKVPFRLTRMLVNAMEVAGIEGNYRSTCDPSNLMLDRKTGKVLHIDFGDCFEVAMQREKFPEKVPFRLTRMLVNAMEVAGIEGNYRSTCEKVGIYRILLCYV